jgi:serine/threonine protein kinase
MTRREAAAYTRLANVNGVPRLIGRIPPDGLLVEYVEGATRLKDSGETNLKLEFFDQVLKILEEIRERGVLHGDVKNNVVIDCDGKPHLVDFGASFVVPFWLLSISSGLMRVGRAYDEKAILRLKYLLAPQSITSQEERRWQQPLPFEKLVATSEKILKLLIQWLFSPR